MIYSPTSRNMAKRAIEKARVGEIEAALRDGMAACAIDPAQASLRGFLSTLKLKHGDLEGAIEDMDRAVRLNPHDVKQLLTLGELLRRAGRIGETLDLLRDTATKMPDDERVWINLGYTYQQAWLPTEAVQAYRRVLCLCPERTEFAFLERLALPAVSQSAGEIAHWRCRYALGVERLRRIARPLEDPTETMGTPGFYLPYKDENLRPIMEALSGMFSSVSPSLNHHASWIDNWTPPPSGGRKIRVGFISEYLFNHTIGKLFQGFIDHLDPRRFEVTLIHWPSTPRDGLRAQFDAAVDQTITLPKDIQAQRRVISEFELDVLFYPEIGMSPSAYFLAYSRLAPVQAVSWGHGGTTGLDTIDYFVSSETMEPEGADQHYTERLIRLSRIVSCYSLPPGTENRSARSSWGLPESGTLYGCPQALFKLHPDFDSVLAEIARQDQSGHIVFMQSRNGIRAELLRKRWARNHPILLDRAIFLPQQPFPRFLELIGQFDVFLDTPHTGCGNTLFEAMFHGVPIVTWPGHFLRGRVVAAAYAQLGIRDAPVVEFLEDYAGMAISLAHDPVRRESLRKRTRIAARERLFTDLTAVRDFESFLENAVQARGDGNLLPKSWRPVQPSE
jgi:protein O-GlcNAc transferase